MSQFTVILLVVIVSLICLFIWNGITLRTLKKNASLEDKELNDAKYWELKYKYEFLIAIVALVTAIAGFLGYNSLQSIETTVKKEFNNKVDSVKNTLQKTKDSVNNLNDNVKASQSQLQKNRSLMIHLFSQQFELKKSGFQSKKALNDLLNVIDSINVKNKIKSEFYLIPNIKLKGQLFSAEPMKFKFSELKTNTGDKLPLFRKPPIIISAMSNSTEFKILTVTNESFEVSVNVYNLTESEIIKHFYYGAFIIYPIE